MVTPKGARGHIVPPFFVHFWRPKAPLNDDCDVFFFCVLLLRVAQMVPKPPEWLVQLTPALRNWFSYSCLGRSLTASHKGTCCLSSLRSLSGNGATGFSKRFTGSALLSCVTLLAKPFLHVRGHTACLPGSRLHSQLFPTLCYELGISPLLAAVTLGSHTDVIRPSYACRHGPTAQTWKSDAAAGPRPRSLSGNSREKFPRKIFFRACGEVFRPGLRDRPVA